jgi:DNA repair exonuclease SbcCD nuclease subunit
MTRLVHTADTHVGYQQYHSPERRADFLRAFESVVDDAVRDDVDAVVHAGDLFHDRRPGLVDIQGVIAALRRLDDAGIPFLAVVGNHETKRDAQWLDLFEDLGLATRLGREPVVVGDVALYGQDFVPAAARESLDYAFAPSEAAVAALVSHGAFEPFAHADWDTESLLEASPVDFDTLLLGDIHHAGRETVDGVLATYPGSTERASAAEREERGYNLVEFDPGGDVPVSVTRRSVADAREFVFVDLELAAGEGEARVREAVRQHDLTDAVLVVTVEGEGDPITPAGVEEQALDAGAAIARVNDRREHAGEAGGPEVSFADPDQAVEARLAEMGLSEAAHGVDALVRTAGDVADSNVRAAAKRRVRERLSEDPASLERLHEAESEGDTDDGERESGDRVTTTADDGESEGDAGGGRGSDDGGDEDGTSEGETTETVESAAAAAVEEESPETDGDGQASMEEYL